MSVFCVQISWSQIIEIQGKIVSKSSDLENITVYNSVSKKGTITNINGEFIIEVKLNDVIQVSALSFNKVEVTITDEIIKSKLLTLLVNEKVNTLDEVVILTHNLTGEIVVDVENAKYFTPVAIDVGTIKNLEFDDIRMDKVDNAFLKKGQLYNGFDPVEILKLFGVAFKKKKKPKYPDLKVKEVLPILDLSEVYSPEFIHENFNIPLGKTEAFHAFVVANSFNYTLLKKENEVELLEFLLAQSTLFLKGLDAQD